MTDRWPGKLTTSLLRSVLSLALLCGAAPAHASDREPAKVWHARAKAAAADLDRRWGNEGGWTASENWQRFPIADALFDYEQRTGDKRWSKKIATAVRNRSGLYLNDDDPWAVIANVHAWQLDHDAELLAWATANYRRIVTTYWDDHCAGGIWWDRNRTYKNAITNELAVRFYAALSRNPAASLPRLGLADLVMVRGINDDCQRWPSERWSRCPLPQQWRATVYLQSRSLAWGAQRPDENYQ